jgi:chitodextrinase
MGGSAYAKVTATPASTDATITWKTYEPATTQVKFGITPGYGSVTPANQLLTTSHTVVVTGLLPRTTYHYQANSVDAAGNVAALQDQTFTTAQ